jgi:hypothetical protein
MASALYFCIEYGLIMYSFHGRVLSPNGMKQWLWEDGSTGRKETEFSQIPFLPKK